MIVTGMLLGYSYGVEFFIAWYSNNIYERAIFFYRAFGDYAWALWLLVACNVGSPLLFFFSKVRAQHGVADRSEPARQRGHVLRALRHHRNVARARLRSVHLAACTFRAGPKSPSWPAASPGSSCCSSSSRKCFRLSRCGRSRKACPFPGGPNEGPQRHRVLRRYGLVDRRCEGRAGTQVRRTAHHFTGPTARG